MTVQITIDKHKFQKVQAGLEDPILSVPFLIYRIRGSKAYT